MDGKYDHSNSLGQWYSWDTPTGLSLGLIGMSLALALVLSSVGFFAVLLKMAGIL